MIASIRYSLFTSDEFSTFANRAISIIDAKKTPLPTIIPFLTNTELKYAQYCAAMERESKNPFTKAQGINDTVRNNAFLAFRSGCESAASRNKAGFSEAATAILDVIHKQGWSAQLLGMKAKSSVLRSIISEIRTKRATELALIGLEELLAELDAAQTDFETTFNQKLEVASTTQEPIVTETRPQLEAALRAMLQFIGLQQIAAPSAEVTALINSLNELITTSLTTVKASETRAENSKKAADSKAAPTN